MSWVGAQNLSPENVDVIRQLQMPHDPMAVARSTATDFLIPEYMRPKTHPVVMPEQPGKMPAVERPMNDAVLGGMLDVTSNLIGGGAPKAGMTAAELAQLFLIPYMRHRGGMSGTVVNDLGKGIATTALDFKPKGVYVGMIDHWDNKGGYTSPTTANTLGPREMRSLLPEVQREYVNEWGKPAETIGGMRMSGAREKARNDWINAEEALWQRYSRGEIGPQAMSAQLDEIRMRTKKGEMSMPMGHVQAAPPVPQSIIDLFKGRRSKGQPVSQADVTAARINSVMPAHIPEPNPRDLFNAIDLEQEAPNLSALLGRINHLRR